MADQDELRLRIVPELDQNAKKQVEDDLNSISGNIPVGGGGTGGGEAESRKRRLADIRAEIDLIDLRARKETIARQKNIADIQKEMALGRMSMQEGTKLIAEQEQLRESAAQEAIRDIQLQNEAAEQLNLTLSERASIERKAFFATERVNNGFTTMSGSMTQLTSNTKDANIAFANFGRIVQDAPFGLLGLSNNIDPLLNSFAQLKASAGGTGLALKAMGRVLLGPAGLIFLAGSLLPTALLFAQKALDRKKKSTEDATNELTDFQRALRSAAGTQLGELIPATVSFTNQLRALESALGSVNQSIGVQNLEIVNQAAYLQNGVVNLGLYNKAQQQLNSISTSTRKALAEQSQAVIGGTLAEDEAVREIIQSRINEAKASEAIERALQRLGVRRQRNVEDIRAEQQAQEDFDFYMLRRGRPLQNI